MKFYVLIFKYFEHQNVFGSLILSYLHIWVNGLLLKCILTDAITTGISHPFGVFITPGTVLSTLPALSNLIFSTCLQGSHYHYSHFTALETAAH